MAEYPPSSDDGSFEPTPWQRWQAELHHAEEDFQLRRHDHGLRERIASRYYRLAIVLGSVVAILVLPWSVLQGVEVFNSLPRAAPSSAASLTPKEREVLVRLQVRLAALPANQLLSPAFLTSLVDSVSGATKLPTHSVKKLVDVALDGGKDVLVHTADDAIDRLLKPPEATINGATLLISQVCERSEAPPPKGDGGRPPPPPRPHCPAPPRPAQPPAPVKVPKPYPGS